MKQKQITVYATNCVHEKLVDHVKQMCEKYEDVIVSFDVIGRTKHMCLAHELAEKLGAKYDVQIEYMMYLCSVKKKDTCVLYRDIETEELLSLEDLKNEYIVLKASNDTEAETFDDYLSNCLAGTLEKLSE